MKLRLFAIRKTGEQQHGTEFFSDLGVARKARDKLINSTGEMHVVCNGPDHRRYNLSLIKIKSEIS